MCKRFVNRRYEMIWNSSLWDETLGIVSEAVTVGSPEITISSNPSIFYYPTSSTVAATAPRLDFPVAMRWTRTGDEDGMESYAGDWVAFFQLDPNQWNDVANRRADPRNYIHLPRSSAGYARIKLVPAPDVDGTVYILGKLKWTAMGDSDEPAIRGADNALLAYGEGDMWQYSRQYAKATAKYQEASELVSMMRDMQRGQKQVIATIIPEVEPQWTIDDIL
jgi:hypothetical protein